VCIQEYLTGSSITASAVRGITLDQRHAAADQIKAVSHKSRGKINSKDTERKHKFPMHWMSQHPSPHESRGKINFYATEQKN